MAQNKSYKELMELYGTGSGAAGSAGSGGGTAAGSSTGGGGTATSNQMLELILNRAPAQYNPATDPAAQAARKQAARNAYAATRDTLGQYAGMTGGMPSTAAVSAAAQAGNQALAAGADKVAELEQLYLNNYDQETQNMYSAYGALQQSESDAWSRQMQEQQWQYQKEQDAQSRADVEYERKLALAQLAAAYGDYSGLKELGIDTSAAAAGGGGGGYHYSGSGGSGGGNGGGGLDAATKNELKFQYGSQLPADVWDQLAAQYGEAALSAAGFTKKKAASGGGGSGGTGGGKPGGGNNRVDLMQ